jgi:hypothetical protein
LPNAPTFNWSPIRPENLTAPFKIDDPAIRHAFASDMTSRLRHEIQRAQGAGSRRKDPIGWHGIPPRQGAITAPRSP